MSAIDQVIARARQGDVGFSERKQFKLARRRAIEKLRRFALADPYFYILEIIQAAVAGGADYVDIACGDGDVLISWTGGIVGEDELAQLFDFLFASKERLDLAHVRSLALGVNALLLFEPDEVVIESGDGTPGGTSRMVVRAGAEQVDVGRAEGRLAGTYVRATKLKRRRVGARTGRHGDDGGSLEYGTVETRCLAAPVPVIFNGQPLFGWARQRVPNLFGYEKVHSFDEGDLYGTIGLKPTGGEPSFALLTQGVWVQSYQYELLENHKFGGIVCFDRLHKTADHSGFVRDDRFAELWIRLRPYAEALVRGKVVVAPKITSIDGLEYTPLQLREFLREHPRIVVIPPMPRARAPKVQTEIEDASWRGKSIARMLEARVLRVDDSQVTAVRVLGGHDLLIWRPQLSDGDDQRFYNSAELEPPGLPHLLAPVELETPTLEVLIDELLAITDERELFGQLAQAGLLADMRSNQSLKQRMTERLRVMLGETGSVRATLYSPVDPGRAAGGLLVRVTTTGRLLGERLFVSAYPGRVLDVELPTAQPAGMRATDIPALVAECFAARTPALLREQDQRALAGLGVGKIEPDSPAARLALQVLSRVTVTRLRAARPGVGGSGVGGSAVEGAGLSFSLLRSVGGFDPFTLPLLRTLAGDPISLRELALLSDHTGGLVYGTIPEVPADLEGLDLRRILALDASTERTLISLLGEAGYVRVDARDVLAQAGAIVVRDVALGLREYPDFPLMIEGGVEGGGDLLETRADLLEILLAGLKQRMLGEADEAAHDLGHDPGELEEHRRQAVRHLQWYVCREYARVGPEPLERLGLLDLPLFVDLDGEVWAMRQVAAVLGSAEGLLVHYGHAFGGAELGSLSAAARAGRRPPEGRPSSLALSGFCYRLLVPLGRVRLAFDFDLDDAEAGGNPATAGTAFLVEESFASDWGTGVLGIPATRVPEYRIQLRTRERGAVAALDELAQVYGVVGSIELRDGRPEHATPEAIIAAVDQQATALLERLIAKLPEFLDHADHDDHDAREARRHEAALAVLLTYAGEQLTMISDATGLTAQVSTPLAMRILGLPLFDTGAATLVSGQRIIERFRQDFEREQFGPRAAGSSLAPVDWSQIVVKSTPKLVLDWLDAHLQPAAVIMPASSIAPLPNPANSNRPSRPVWDKNRRVTHEVLAWNLEHWLAQLRLDERDGTPTRIWVSDYKFGDSTLVEGNDRRLDVWADHPLVNRAIATPTASNLAWLLLAIYGHINAVATLVTNTHEMGFHLIVGAALVEGRLQVLVPEANELSSHAGG